MAGVKQRRNGAVALPTLIEGSSLIAMSSDLLGVFGARLRWLALALLD